VNLGIYIHTILSENETVIIPGLGAFITKYKPAEIGENEIKPPSKEISFTSRIKNNDGLLVAAVARKRKISQAKALIKVEKERENILYQLDKGEKITLEFVGELFYNEQNKLQFEPLPANILFSDDFGFGIISTEDVPEITEEPIVKVEEPSESESPVLPESDSEPQSENIEKQEEAQSEILEPKNKITEPPTQKFESVSKNKPGADYDVNTSETKKGRQIFWLLLLIPLAFGLYFLIQKNKKPALEKITEAPKIEMQPETNKVAIDTTTQFDTTLNATKQQITEITAKEYYLVGGGFKSEENAEKYILLLKEKGIDGFELGKRGNIFLVGIASFDTEQKAYKALNEYVKNYPEWNLWVYKK